MPNHISRRKAISAGTAAAALLLGTGCSKPEKEITVKASSPPFLTPWSPPSDLESDLTPGSTSIRLAAWSNKTTLDYPKDISITEMVKRILDYGYTSGNVYITETVPGKGMLDYETYLVRLSRLSSPRTLLIEHIPDNSYPEAKKFIKDAAKKVSVKIYS